jgi:solute:Na+ symporter, SSS family
VLVLIIYLLLFIGLIFIQKNRQFQSLFKVSKKVSWLISGFSLFMLQLSVDQGQFLSGIIAQYGMKGLWLVWCGIIGSFVIPLVFAPLWQKMNFITDNQFLLFRFPGRSGRMLHLFRAVYVGGLVVSLSLCFHLLGFSRVLQTYFGFSDNLAICYSGVILCLYSLKNAFGLKFKIDALNAVIYISCLLLIFISVWQVSDGWDSMYAYFDKYPEKKSLLPADNDQAGWFILCVFIGIQWWSCNLFDGGGPEMARFTAVKNKKHAVSSGLLAVFFSVILSFFIIAHILFLLGVSDASTNQELSYVQSVFNIVPVAFKSFLLLGFFVMFISVSESVLIWGTSFLTIDAYKEYLNPTASEKKIRFISYFSMVFLTSLAVVFAVQIDNMQSLIKLSFSIAAGVAPVYILRWIWFRINAWSQLSAMFSSGFFTLLYPMFHDLLPFKEFPMEESRILVVTLLTSAVWLLVTFLTPNQSDTVYLKMMPIIESRKRFVKRFVLALLFGVLLTGVVSLIWWKILL